MSALALQQQALLAALRARYLSAGDYDRNQNIVNNRIGSYVYYDVGGAYRLGGEGRVELYASANNVFNKKAPIAATFSPYYDVMGAYYTAGVRVKF